MTTPSEARAPSAAGISAPPDEVILRLGSADELAVILAGWRRGRGTRATDNGSTEPETPVRAPELRSLDELQPGQSVLLPWLGYPTGIAPLELARTLQKRGHPTRILTACGQRLGVTAGFLVIQSARAALFLLTAWILRAAAAVLAWLFGSGTRPPLRIHKPSSHQPPAPTNEPLGLTIVLPILPDLSHTFVYREALAVCQAEPGTRVIALERGARGVVPDHPESEALLTRGVDYIPPRGIVRRFLQTLRWMCVHPRRVGEFCSLYRDADGSRIADLFGKLPLRDPRHPGNTFALATALRDGPGSGPIHVYGSTYATNVTHGASILCGRTFSVTTYVDFDFPYQHQMLREKFAASAFFRVCTGYCQTRLTKLLPDFRAELGEAGFATQVPVILFGIPLDKWSPRRGRGPGTGVLFSASRLVPKKGLHLLPPAIAALRAEGAGGQAPSTTWRIAGDGPERDRLEALVDQHGIRDAVTFLGSIPSDAVHNEIVACDLAILPCVVADDGERDGIPIFFNEAMACAVPILTTPISGIPELITDGESGFLVSTPDDEAVLTERLGAALADPTRLHRIGLGGRAAVEAHLDIEQSAAALLAEIRRTS